MLRPGLLSITFRKLPVKDIIDHAKDAKLEGIEWGGDVHVPDGMIDMAKEVGQMTRDAGMEVAAYGSYYRAGLSPADMFSRVLDSAMALQAKIIRVWAGKIGSAEADDATRSTIVDDLKRISEIARQAGVTLACEWHANTLTDTAESAQRLFEEVDHPAFKTYWQPPTKRSFEQNLAEIDIALPRLVGVHVFQWDQQTGERQPLARGEDFWPKYLEKCATAGDIFAMLEFVKDDSVDQMKSDAKVLRSWLNGLSR